MRFAHIFYKSLTFSFRRIYEILFIYSLRLRHYIQHGSLFVGDETKYKEFIFDYSNFVLSLKNRKAGISGFYRVKNEEELLEASVESHIPYLDEIIIVYNDCSDKTPEIAKKLQDKYPNKIKVYEYKPKVFPPLSYEHIITPANSPHSLVNYYNFTLSKTTRTIAVKIDADHIAVEDRFRRAVEKIKKEGLNTMAYFYGLNIYPCGAGGRDVCINRKRPFTYGYDCGFFPVSKNTYFVHRRKFESLKLPFHMYLTRKMTGVLFYHLKGLKKDKGLSNVNKKHPYARILQDVYFNPDLIHINSYKHDLIDDVVRENVYKLSYFYTQKGKASFI